MNKRGQFFLIAAIVIVGIVVGLANITNIARTSGEADSFYDLSEEIGFESKQVLDYGIYNADETAELTQKFLEEYTNYIVDDRVVFVYGNAGGLNVSYFDYDETGSVGIETGGLGVVQLSIEDWQERETTLEETGGEVIVQINDVDYDFELRDGQNFFFVLIREENDERFVTTG